MDEWKKSETKPDYNYRNWTPFKFLEEPMTDMQTVNYLIKCYNIKKLNNRNRGRNTQADRNDLVMKGLQKVKKNLQVLEMFKTIAKRKDNISTAFHITDDKKMQTDIIITLDTLEDKDILCSELIKEWLNDGK
jgi:hypothetical protein